MVANITSLLHTLRHCSAKFKSCFFFFLLKKTSFVSEMKLRELPNARYFKLNNVVFCLHAPFNAAEIDFRRVERSSWPTRDVRRQVRTMSNVRPLCAPGITLSYHFYSQSARAGSAIRHPSVRRCRNRRTCAVVVRFPPCRLRIRA